MAYPTIQLIHALRDTAQNLRNGAIYAWGHHGTCNCGNLAQTITDFSAGEILRTAQEGIGEWSELVNDYCPESDKPMDLLIDKLLQTGLSPSDLHHIEYLSDKEVLTRLPGGFRWLKRNNKEDVILYFETFAHMVEDKLAELTRREEDHSIKVLLQHTVGAPV